MIFPVGTEEKLTEEMLTTQHPQAEPVSKHQSEDEQQHVETLPMEDPTVLEVFESAE